MTPEVVKTCESCAHRRAEWFMFIREPRLDECARTGFLCSVQRRFPDSGCDENFSGWVQRPESLLLRIISSVFGRGEQPKL